MRSSRVALAGDAGVVLILLATSMVSFRPVAWLLCRSFVRQL